MGCRLFPSGHRFCRFKVRIITSHVHIDSLITLCVMCESLLSCEWPFLTGPSHSTVTQTAKRQGAPLFLFLFLFLFLSPHTSIFLLPPPDATHSSRVAASKSSLLPPLSRTSWAWGGASAFGHSNLCGKELLLFPGLVVSCDNISTAWLGLGRLWCHCGCALWKLHVFAIWWGPHPPLPVTPPRIDFGAFPLLILFSLSLTPR